MIDCHAFLGGLKQLPPERLIFRPLPTLHPDHFQSHGDLILELLRLW